jgi:hypothetical protein
MPNSKELELERQSMLRDMAVKIDYIYTILREATIGTSPTEEKKSESKTRKKTKKA